MTIALVMVVVRDVTKFVFAFNNMRIFDIFTAIRYSGISGIYEYFISFNLIELYWILDRKYWQWREHKPRCYILWTGLTELCLRYRCWFSLTEHWTTIFGFFALFKYWYREVFLRLNKYLCSTNSQVNICIWRIRIFFRLVTSLVLVV